MPDIVLKDRNGNDITYPGINSIKVRTTNGDKRTFVHGEMVEKTVDPDFSKGDIEITAAENTFISKVTIEKPEDLSPENIREGKEIGGVAGSAFVVDMVETAILEEKTYDDFSEVQGTGIYAPSFAYEFNFVVGETYYVVWDDEEYVCVAYEVDGLTGIGNAAIAGMGEDTGEPFLMGDNGWVAIATLETDASHVIGVSQKAREDAETAVVELSLADGDQEVIPSASDKVLTKAIIKKPETLVPENIAKDVEIAGVVGELESGGGAEIAYGDESWLDDVCFWDYDGTMILNIPFADAATLSELPTPPAHDGLTFLGWNYTLEQINAAEYPIDIGAMYIPSDGKTHLHLNITSSSNKALPLNFSQTVSGGVSINWGDGTAATTVSGTGLVTATHTYSATGKYEVVITVADGCVMTLGSGTNTTTFIATSSKSTYWNYPTELYIGRNVELSEGAFVSTVNIEKFTIPNTITSIPKGSLYRLMKAKCVIIPNSVTSIGENGLYQAGYNNKETGAISIPESVTEIGKSCFYSYSMKRVSIPKTVKTIPAAAIFGWYYGKRVFMSDDVTSIDYQNFYNWYSLRKLKLPESLQTLGNMNLYNCYVVEDVRIPPNLKTVNGSFMQYCYGIREVYVPASVEDFGAMPFYQSTIARLIFEGNVPYTSTPSVMQSLQEIIHLSPTVPTVKAASYTYLYVWVPDESVEAFKTLYGTGAKVCKLSEYNGVLPTYN